MPAMQPVLSKLAGPLTASLAILLMFLLRAAAGDSTLRRELRQAVLFLLSYLGLHLAGLGLDPSWPRYGHFAHVASYLVFAFGLIRGVTSVSLYLARTRAGVNVHKIVRDVIDALLYLVAAVVILRSTTKFDLGSLLTTSAILSVVLGLALQETLGNLFAGLSLQIEPPFEPGDWIGVGQHVGRVQQLSWRTTRILTPRNEQVILTNSSIGKEQLINYSRSGDGVAYDLLFEVDYESPPNAVIHACAEVIAAHPKVRRAPAPVVRAVKFEASGIQYQARYFVDDFGCIFDVRSELLSQLWYRLRREGFTLPFPTRSVMIHQAPGKQEQETVRRELAQLLSSVDFLKPLDEQARLRLAGLAKMQLFGVGEQVIRQGDEGQTFFLIVSGEMAVRIQDGTEVARLRRGEFFGEMSLLTGEARSATVVAAQDSTLLSVDRPAFAEILKANPELARSLSEALALRSGELKARAVGSAAPHEASLTMESNRIFARLRDIFSLR